MQVAPGIFTMAVVMVNFDSKSTKINIPVPQPMLVWGVHTWGWPSAGPIKSTNKAIPGYTLCPITQRCGDEKYNLRDIFRK